MAPGPAGSVHAHLLVVAPRWHRPPEEAGAGRPVANRTLDPQLDL
jgi:hypothetical protein